MDVCMQYWSITRVEVVYVCPTSCCQWFEENKQRAHLFHSCVLINHKQFCSKLLSESDLFRGHAQEVPAWKLQLHLNPNPVNSTVVCRGGLVAVHRFFNTVRFRYQQLPWSDYPWFQVLLVLIETGGMNYWTPWNGSTVPRAPTKEYGRHPGTDGNRAPSHSSNSARLGLSSGRSNRYEPSKISHHIFDFSYCQVSLRIWWL